MTMPSLHPYRRLLLSLAASTILHVLMVASPGIDGLAPHRVAKATPAMLEARLHALNRAEPVRSDQTEPILKNTLNEVEPDLTPSAPTWVQISPAPGSVEPGVAVATIAPTQAARRKPSQERFYPPEAVARGIEGEVRLLLTLDEQGKVLDARIARSSGYAILDQAALRAVHAAGRLSDSGAQKLILPVVFKLE